VFLEVLAGKFTDALAGLTTVDYSGGRFGRKRRVEQVAVSFGERRFTLRARPGGVAAEVAHEVRGVRLSGREVSLDEWLRLFAEELSRYAVTETRGREALGRLLS
jgi:hypothetical protein